MATNELNSKRIFSAEANYNEFFLFSLCACIKFSDEFTSFSPLPARPPLSAACCCCHWFLPTIGLFVVASHVNCMYNIDAHANARKGQREVGRGMVRGPVEASVDANADANVDWKC